MLFIGSLFAQDTLKLKSNDIIYIGKLESVSEGLIGFKLDREVTSALLRTDKIDYLYGDGKLLIKDGTVVDEEFNAKVEVSSKYETNNDSDSININYSIVGGICIALSGAINYSIELDGEKYRDDPSKYSKEAQNTEFAKSKLSAGLLLIGGVLIALDR